MRFSGKKLVSVLFGGFVVLLGTGCAPYQALKANDERPMLASMGPMAPVPLIGEASSDNDDYSAGALLERAFMFFHQNHPHEAADSFFSAISTGSLNNAGRALAYWHIAEAGRQMHDEDRTAEALSSFSLVAQDVLDDRPTRKYAVDENGDFVDNFKLDLRVAEARAYVNAAWTRRSYNFGRSMKNPVVAKSKEECDYFIEFVSPCSGSPDQQVTREALTEIDGFPLLDINVERITVFCDSIASVDQFFVVYPVE